MLLAKLFQLMKFFHLLRHGHTDYGENKVQEATNKWSDIKLEYPHIKLHLIGKLQTNKVKLSLKLFNYIHSLDSEKLARKIATEEENLNKKD